MEPHQSLRSSSAEMPDFLDMLVRDAHGTVRDGYYSDVPRTRGVGACLRDAILESRGVALIAEIKAASPSEGNIRDFDPIQLARTMESCGVAGVSVLTEPRHFKGDIRCLGEVRASVKLPLLMKDIVVHPAQVEAASRAGADAVLLIQAVFDRGNSPISRDEMIQHAHSLGLEVLLESHTGGEFSRAVESGADLVGINNRDLGTLRVNIHKTGRILSRHSCHGKVIVSESGIRTRDDIRLLREAGSHAFLVGTAIMSSSDVSMKIKELLNPI